MAGSSAPTALVVSDTIYRLLLRLCPAAYYHDYGRPMAQAFRDLAREAHRGHGAWGVAALWLRILPDAGATALAEHVLALKERRAVAKVELATAGAEGGYTMRSPLSSAGARALSIGALLVGVFCIWPFYSLAAYALLWRVLPESLSSSSLSNWVAGPMLLWTFPPSILLSNLGRYLAVSAVGIVLAAGALLFGPRRRMLIAAEALTLAAILAFPWFYHYETPIVAAPGRVLYVATQPGLLDGVVKQAQEFAEHIPSTYEILGWGADGVLYYRETAKATQTTRTWAYGPGPGAHPRLVAAPAETAPAAAAPREQLLELVRAPGGPRYELAARDYGLGEHDGVASPDGRWAAVVTRHVYGPEDVVVIALD